MKLLHIITLIISTFISYCNNTYLETRKYEDIPGLQLYHLTNKNYYLFSSWEMEDHENIQGTIYLFLTNDITYKNIWASVGLGTPGMHGSDMVMCTYVDGKSDCSDYYSNGHSPVPDVALGGTNDVTFEFGDSSFKLNSHEWNQYSKYYVWSFKKKLNSEDKYDWDRISSMMANKQPVIAAFGEVKLLDNTPDIQFHMDFTSGRLVDGFGLSDKNNSDL